MMGIIFSILSFVLYAFIIFYVIVKEPQWILAFSPIGPTTADEDEIIDAMYLVF